MVMAQKRRAKQAPATVDESIDLLRKLQSEDSSINPVLSSDIPTLVETALEIHRTLLPLLREEPAEGTEEHRIYSEALVTLGGPDQSAEAAIAALNEEVATVIYRLNFMEDLDYSNPAVIGDQSDNFYDLLLHIESNLTNRDAEYREEFRTAYSSVGNTHLPMLIERMAGNPAIDITEQDFHVDREPVASIYIPELKPEIVHRLYSGESAAAAVIQPEGLPRSFVGLFGGEETARDVLDAFADVYSGQRNHEPGSAQAREIGHRLASIFRNSLGQNSDVASMPDYQDFMNALESGDLEGAIEAFADLREGHSSLELVYDILNQLYVIEVDSRSISTFHFGLWVTWELDEESANFNDFVNGLSQTEPDTEVLRFAVGLHHHFLEMSGSLQEISITGNGIERTGEARPLTGEGNLFSVSPQLVLGTAIGGLPWEIVIHCNFGWHQFDVGADIPTPPYQLTAGTDGYEPYFGMVGIELRQPGISGQRDMIRVSTYGVQMLDPFHAFTSESESPRQAGVLGYVTVEGNWYEGRDWRFQSFLTPRLSYMLESFRLAGSLRPADVATRIENSVDLYFGPSVDYEYNVGDDARSSHTTRIGGQVGANWNFIGLEVTGGYVWEGSGVESPYVGVNLNYVPSRHFRRAERPIPASLSNAYLDAVDALDSGDAEQQDNATENLLGVVNTLRSTELVFAQGYMPEFNEAIRFLEDGNLQQAVASFGRIPGFTELE